jgi:hypothetical protein
MKIQVLILAFSFLVSAFPPSLNSFAQEVSKKTLNRVKLNKILQKSKEYCRKLEKGAFNFVCLEEVVEKFYHEGVDQQMMVAGSEHDRVPRDAFGYEVYKKTKENNFLYEYQLIAKAGEDQEKRVLLEKNGKKKNEKDASLETQYFRYGRIVFGPLGLLNGYWQQYHDYEIVGEDKIGADKAIVVAATPKSSLGENHPYGKVWVRESDFAILKIEWDQKSLTTLEELKKQASMFGANQVITIISEFGYEKNEVRFPSRFLFEEAYVNKEGKKVVRSMIHTVYRDYKFFTVDVDVNFN